MSGFDYMAEKSITDEMLLKALSVCVGFAVSTDNIYLCDYDDDLFGVADCHRLICKRQSLTGVARTHGAVDREPLVEVRAFAEHLSQLSDGFVLISDDTPCVDLYLIYHYENGWGKVVLDLDDEDYNRIEFLYAPVWDSSEDAKDLSNKTVATFASVKASFDAYSEEATSETPIKIFVRKEWSLAKFSVKAMAVVGIMCLLPLSVGIYQGMFNTEGLVVSYFQLLAGDAVGFFTSARQ